MSDLDCCSLGQRTDTLLALPYLPDGSSPGPCTAFRGLERIYRVMFLADCSWGSPSVPLPLQFEWTMAARLSSVEDIALENICLGLGHLFLDVRNC